MTGAVRLPETVTHNEAERRKVSNYWFAVIHTAKFYFLSKETKLKHSNKFKSTKLQTILVFEYFLATLLQFLLKEVIFWG